MLAFGCFLEAPSRAHVTRKLSPHQLAYGEYFWAQAGIVHQRHMYSAQVRSARVTTDAPRFPGYKLPAGPPTEPEGANTHSPAARTLAHLPASTPPSSPGTEGGAHIRGKRRGVLQLVPAVLRRVLPRRPAAACRACPAPRPAAARGGHPARNDRMRVRAEGAPRVEPAARGLGGGGPR